MVETAPRARRRRRRFESYDQMLDEVRRLAGQPTRQLGNWSLGQICQHLGVVMERCTAEGAPFRVGWHLRLLGRLVRPHALKHGVVRGFRLPAEGAALVPAPCSLEAGLVTLERGIEALAATSYRTSHPIFGALSVDQWTLFHLRHAEMHLSHIVPE